MIKVSNAFVEKARNTPILRASGPQLTSRNWSPYTDSFLDILGKLFPNDKKIERALLRGSRGLISLSHLLEQKSASYAEKIWCDGVDEELLNGAYLSHILAQNCLKTATEKFPSANQTTKGFDYEYS